MLRRRIVAVLVCVLLGGCTRVGTSGPSARHAWTHPGVLRLADVADPDHFNPLLSTMDLVEDLSSLVYSYLVIADGDGKLVGDLATDVPTLANGGISKDGRTYTYHLRPGVVWHDGKPFGARDVIATWRAIVNPDNNVLHREGYDRVERIDAPDRHTLVVHLKGRYPPFVTKFFTTLQEGSKAVLPAHLIESLSTINRAPINAAPVGTGPFKFVRWDRGRGMVFVANERYFKGRPKLDRIEFRVLPDDNTILNSVQAHETDLVVSAPSALFDRYRALEGVTSQLYPWNAETVFIINNAKPGLRHLEVRQAVALALDYPTLVHKVSHDVGTFAHDVIPPGAIGYTENEPYRYDPAAAARLLDDNGWKPGPDGIRAKNGERLAFTFVVSTGAATARAITVVAQADLRAIGIDLQVKTYPYNVIFSYEGPIKSGTYDFASYTYTLPWDPDYSVYLLCAMTPPKGENDFRYCDPQVDAGERAGMSTDDPLKRAAIYRPVERRIHETVPYIPLYLLRRPTVHNTDLKNYKPAPSIAPWWNAYQWEI